MGDTTLFEQLLNDLKSRLEKNDEFDPQMIQEIMNQLDETNIDVDSLMKVIESTTQGSTNT